MHRFWIIVLSLFISNYPFSRSSSFLFIISTVFRCFLLGFYLYLSLLSFITTSFYHLYRPSVIPSLFFLSLFILSLVYQVFSLSSLPPFCCIVLFFHHHIPFLSFIITSLYHLFYPAHPRVVHLFYLPCLRFPNSRIFTHGPPLANRLSQRIYSGAAITRLLRCVHVDSLPVIELRRACGFVIYFLPL